jgi:hypothetical protein
MKLWLVDSYNPEVIFVLKEFSILVLDTDTAITLTKECDVLSSAKAIKAPNSLDSRLSR